MAILRNENIEPVIGTDDKPTVLYHAVAKMEAVSERLDTLYSRLTKEDGVQTDCCSVQPDASLREVLNECPRLIAQHLQAQHSRIEEIEKLIFDQ